MEPSKHCEEREKTQWLDEIHNVREERKITFVAVQTDQIERYYEQRIECIYSKTFISVLRVVV